MASFPVQVLLGLYLGVLTGIIPAAIAWVLGFVFKYLTGVTVPGFGVVVLGVAIAGVNGGLLALNDPTIRGAPNAVTLLTAIVVVLMLTLYAHAQGDRMGAEFPRRLSLRALRARTLSADVIDRVGGRGQVRLSVAGEVEDMEGYPPLPADLRASIREGEWTFPADVPLVELEIRLADTLRTEFDLADVAVTLDEHGHATVAAAPPFGGVSGRVPPGRRAVSVEALLPAGIAPGEEVRVVLDGDRIAGTVVSAGASAPPAVTDGGEGAPPPATPQATPGEGRVTVAVARDDAPTLLRADRAGVVVRSRGTRREFELLSLLRRAGKRFRRLSVGEGSDLAGTTIGSADLRESYGVVVLAVRRAEGWTLAPGGDETMAAGDDLFVVGTREALDRFAGVVA